MIYIEPVASRSPLAFWKSNESSKEEKNVKWEIFEVLWCVAIVGKGFEETLWGLWKHFSLATPAIIIIIDYKEEE